MAELAILVPVLNRPGNVEPLLASIEEATPDARTLFICDAFDKAEIETVVAAGAERIIVTGNYAHKVNQGVRHTTEPLVFLGADDIRFHPGWFEAARGQIIGAGAHVVGTNDLCNPRVIAGEHSTHSLVTRDYCKRGTIDEPGKLLHEGYEHEYVDDELVETAKARGVYAHAKDSIVEHLHPMVGKAPNDALYAAQGARMRRTRRLFDARRPLWTSQ